MPFNMQLALSLFENLIHNGPKHLPSRSKCWKYNDFIVMSFSPLMTLNIKEIRIGRVCRAIVF